jgi:Tat protein secretion system quality control protein TatD with DNase activity
LEIVESIPIEEVNEKCKVKIHPYFGGVIACLAFPKYFQTENAPKNVIEYFRKLNNKHVIGYQVGFHPGSGDLYTRQGLMDAIEIVCNKGCKVLAIGECGLDDGKPIEMELQEAVFKDHIIVAHILGLPMIYHFRGLHCLNRAFEILKVIF